MYTPIKRAIDRAESNEERGWIKKKREKEGARGGDVRSRATRRFIKSVLRLSMRHGLKNATRDPTRKRSGAARMHRLLPISWITSRWREPIASTVKRNVRLSTIKIKWFGVIHGCWGSLRVAADWSGGGGWLLELWGTKETCRIFEIWRGRRR